MILVILREIGDIAPQAKAVREFTTMTKLWLKRGMQTSPVSLLIIQTLIDQTGEQIEAHADKKPVAETGDSEFRYLAGNVEVALCSQLGEPVFQFSFGGLTARADSVH